MIESSGGSNPGNSDLYFQADLQDNVSPTADQIEKRLKQLGASRHEIKMFMTAYDQATPKIKAAQDQLNKMPKEHLTTLKVNADQVDSAHKRLQKLKAIAEAPITLTLKATHDVGDTFDKFKQRIPQMEMQLRNSLRNMPLTAGLLGATGAAYNTISGPLSTMTGLPFSSMGMGIGGLGVAAAGGAFMAQSFQQNARLEQNMAQLTQILRTPAAAQTAYGHVVQTATTTPFNMPDVLQSYIRMAQMGINPNNSAYGIKAAANLGAGAQVPISQATGALQNASLGYFTELNNLTGRNIRQTDFTYGGRYSGETYQQAVMQTLKQYQGASQTQMQTFKGLMTNIQDVITQRLVIPAGAPLFGAVKGVEQQAAGYLQKPQTQLALSREVDKLQEGLVKVFQLVQQGASYFKNSLEMPLKSITQNVVKLGSAFYQAFGGTVLTGVKYLSEALTSIIQPIATIAGHFPVLAQVGGVLKALHMFGVSTNTGFKDFWGGLLSFNPIRMISGIKELTSLIGKLSLYFVVKSFLDMKNANDQLNHSFQGLGSSAATHLDMIKVKFDGLILKANEYGKSVAQLKAYGAGIGEAIGINKTHDPRGVTLSKAEYYGSLDVMKLSSGLNMGGQNTLQVMSTWLKQMGAGDKIYNQGESPRKVMDEASAEIYQAAKTLSKNLGIDLADAAKEATIALTLFHKQLVQAGMATPRGASAAASIYAAFQQPTGMTPGDFKRYGSPMEMARSLISNTVAPSSEILQAALHSVHGNMRFGGNQALGDNQAAGLAAAFSFKSRLPNLHGASTSDIESTLKQYANVPTSSDIANRQIKAAIDKGAPGVAGRLGVNLPQFQNILPQLGITTTSSQVKHMDTTQSAQEIVKLSSALNNVQDSMAKVNQQITATEDNLSKWSIATEEASAALAKLNLKLESQQNAIDQWQLNLSKLQTNSMDPLQRAIASIGQQLADYQQYKILPVARAQENWNQTMLLTSNRLEDVSFSMQKASYNMELFNGGMLKGENALTAQIESLTVYNQKLDMLRLQNMGMQADIARTQFHQGFVTTVQPLMGFSLSREIQLGQERQQMMQDHYDTTYGYEHWRLQRAARTKFQAQEMSFAERMSGTKAAAATLSTGTVETMAIQIQQYREQLHSRKLEEQMFALTVAERPKQDEQFRLNRQMFYLQQNMSLQSSKIAKATEGIQQQQLPLQHALNHIQLVAQIKSATLDLRNLRLNEKLGQYQNVTADLHQLFGEFSKNFNVNIKGGSDTVIGHLKQIGKDMGLSRAALHSIENGLKGFHGGGGGPGGGGPPHPSLLSRGWHLITGLITSPLATLQAAADAAGNAVGSLSNSLGGGIAGTAAAGAVFGAGLLGALNATHVAAVHLFGALGGPRGLAGVGRNMRSSERGAVRGLGAIFEKFGMYLSDLRKGAPWGMALHESAYLRQLPATLAKLGTFMGFSAVGHPGVGAAAAAYVDSIVDKRLGIMNYNVNPDGSLGSYRHGVISKGAYHLVTRPIDTVKGMFRSTEEVISGDTRRAAAATSELSSTIGLTDRLKGTAQRPLIVAMMDGSKAGLGSLAAKMGVNDIAQSITGFGQVSSVDKTFADKMRGVASSLSSTGSSMADSVKTQVQVRLQANRDQLNLFSELNHNTEKSGQIFMNFDEQNAKTVAKAKAAAAVEEDAAKILDKTPGRFSRAISGMVRGFGNVVTRFRRFGGLFSVAVSAFELLPPKWQAAISHFAENVKKFFAPAVDIFKVGATKFAEVIKNDWKAIAGDFKSAVSWFRDGIKHLPGVHFASDVAKAAPDLSKLSSDAADARKLTSELDKSPALKAIAEKAGATGAKILEIGGKVFRIAARGAGALSFLPAAGDALKGQYGKAALQAANAGSYFIPGIGEARIASDLYNLISKALGATSIQQLVDKASKGQMTINPREAAFLTPQQKDQVAQGLAALEKMHHDHVNTVNFIYKNGSARQAVQQQQAQQDALNGPQGLEPNLTKQGAVWTHYHNSILTQAGDFANKHLQTINDGFKGISQVTGGWLTAITKEIATWEKNNQLPITTKANQQAAVTIGSATISVGNIGTQAVTGLSMGFHHGGLVHADNHKVGPGRIIKMVEEGHPEIVIPLAPHRRDRARSLLKHTQGLLGMAAGGYVNPIGRGAVPERVDMGVDYGGNAPLYALGAGTITNSGVGTGGWGPSWINLRLASGKYAGSQIYYAEHIKSLVKTGQLVTAGQHIADLAGGMEIGFAAGSGNSTPALGASEGFTGANSTAAGVAMSNLIASLGGPAGVLQGRVAGKFRGSAVPFLGGLGTTISPLHLKGPPEALKSMGIIGPSQFKILQHIMSKAQSHLNSITAPGLGALGNLSGFHGGGSAAANMILGHKMMLAAGWDQNQWPPLQKLWMNESGWDANIMHNPNGQWLGPGNASGIPQADGHGQVYRRGDAVGQIKWGLEYIKRQYGSPSKAWAFETSHTPNWYAGGLPRVPYDNFPALLHAGESVRSAGDTNIAAGQGAHNAVDVVKILRNIETNTGGSSTALQGILGVQNKMLLAQIEASIKAAGPHSDRLTNLVGGIIHNRGISAAAGIGASNLLQDLINSLHNLTSYIRVANEGKGRIFKIDEHSLSRLDKIISEAGKGDRKDVIKGLHALISTFKHHHETGLAKESQHILSELKHHHITLKQAEKQLEHLRGDLHKKIDSESHLQVKGFHSVVTELTKLRDMQMTLSHDKKHHASKAKIRLEEASIHKLSHTINAEEKSWMHMEEQRGISKKLLKAALKYVAIGDGTTIISDRQLQNLKSIMGHTMKNGQTLKDMGHHVVENGKVHKKHAAAAKKHYGKAEDAANKAWTQRQDHHHHFDAHAHKTEHHHKKIEAKFDDMVSYLSTISKKVGNPPVVNIDVGSSGGSRVQVKTRTQHNR